MNTPKTDAFLQAGDEFRTRDELIEFAREMERLAAVSLDINRLRARVSRLEEALRGLAKHERVCDDDDPILEAAREKARAALEDQT